MSGHDVDILIADYIAGEREPEMMQALAQILDEDPGARAQFTTSLAIDRCLRQSGSAPLSIETVMRALPLEPGTAFQDSVIARIEASPATAPSRDHLPQPEQAQRPVQAWRWGRHAWQAAAMLPLLIGLGLMFALPSPLPTRSGGVVRLARTDSALWGGKPMRAGAILGQAPMHLTSGLAELVSSSGAEIIVEGPADFSVISAQHIELHQGRVTAHVPPPARGFTISARGLEAVDRGTDFGVAVAADGQAQIEVFTGRVDTRLTASASPADASTASSLTLFAGQAATLDPQHGSLRPRAAGGLGFITSISSPIYLDLSDLVAGGDGSGNGRFNGLNPTTGQIINAPALGILRGDRGEYHPVVGSRIFDGVFIPRTTPGGTVIDSAGHRYAFTANDPTVYDLIRRGGTWDVPNYGGTPEHPGLPPVFGGVDYRSQGHTALGMHANCGLTISLRGLAEAHPHQRPVRFTAHVGNVGSKDGARPSAGCWVLVDGRVVQQLSGLSVTSPPATIDVPLGKDDTFLTIVSCVPDNISLCWLTLGDARFELVRSEQP